MRNYTPKKKRARKKTILARKEPKKRKKTAAVAAKKRVAKKTTKRPAKKAAAKRPAAKRPAKKAAAKRPAKKAAAKRPAKKAAAKRPAKKAAAKRPAKKIKRPTRRVPVKRATQKTPARKRGVKNTKIRKKVDLAEKLREKSRRVRITAAQRKAAKEKAERERYEAEQQRLFDEKVRQVKEEQQRQKASKKSVISKLQERFESLLNEAKRTGQLPRVPRGRRQRRVESKRIKGQKVNILIEEMLQPETVEQILYEVKQKIKGLPDVPGFGWLGTINFAGLGESLLGYGQVILSSTLPGASLFQTQGIESTGIRNSKEAMLTALDLQLEQLAGEQNTMIYVNFITISTYVWRR